MICYPWVNYTPQTVLSTTESKKRYLKKNTNMAFRKQCAWGTCD